MWWVSCDPELKWTDSPPHWCSLSSHIRTHLRCPTTLTCLSDALRTNECLSDRLDSSLEWDSLLNIYIHACDAHTIYTFFKWRRTVLLYLKQPIVFLSLHVKLVLTTMPGLCRQWSAHTYKCGCECWGTVKVPQVKTSPQWRDNKVVWFCLFSS